MEDATEKLCYDLIVLGTGLCESMIACSAAQAGKSVLHVDGLDTYGRNEYQMTLSSYIRSNSTLLTENTKHKMIDHSKDEKINHVEETYDILLNKMEEMEDIRHILYSSVSSEELEIAEKACTKYSSRKLHHPIFQGYAMEKMKDGYKANHQITLASALLDNRSFGIEGSWHLVCSNSSSSGSSGSSAVETLIRSGTANYLEFKCLDKLFFCNPCSKKNNSSHSTSSSSSNSGNSDCGSGSSRGSNLEIHPVPCSKGDIFSSKVFTAMEKRRLMKFIVAAMDWGREYDSEGSLTPGELNERVLAGGRSLLRPQNKQALGASSGMAFQDVRQLPASEIFNQFNLTEHIQKYILHGLCLESCVPTSKSHTLLDNSISTEQVVLAMHRHLSGLGRFGSTAFLFPVYGSSEILQAFCRMTAVWGGVYKLRHPLRCLKVDKQTEKVTSVVAADGTEYQTEAFVCSALDWPTSGVDNTNFTSLFRLQRLSVIVGSAFSSASSASSVADTDEIGKILAIIPPSTYTYSSSSLYHPTAVHILQLDDSFNVCASGTSLLYISTYIGRNVTDEQARDLMNSIASDFRFKHLNNSHSITSMNTDNTHNFYELYANISRSPLPTAPSSCSSIPINVAVCGSDEDAIYLHHTIEEAKNICERLLSTSPSNINADTTTTDIPSVSDGEGVISKGNIGHKDSYKHAFLSPPSQDYAEDEEHEKESSILDETLKKVQIQEEVQEQPIKAAQEETEEESKEENK